MGPGGGPGDGARPPTSLLLTQGQKGREEMESTLTFSMLGVRVAEMKAAWVDNFHDLGAAVMQVDWLMLTLFNNL